MRPRSLTIAGSSVVTVAALLLAAGLVLSRGDGGQVRADPEPGVEPAVADVSGREVRSGTAAVVVGRERLDFSLTRCAISAGLVTFQGSSAGRQLVGSFRDNGQGSVTVIGGNDVWAAGPAGGTGIKARVKPPAVRGAGIFARRPLQPDFSLSTSAPPAPGSRHAGSFTLRCPPAPG